MDLAKLLLEIDNEIDRLKQVRELLAGNSPSQQLRGGRSAPLVRKHAPELWRRSVEDGQKQSPDSELPFDGATKRARLGPNPLNRL